MAVHILLTLSSMYLFVAAIPSVVAILETLNTFHLRDLGIPDVRYHDLRHSYAVAAIESGDDIKTVQGNLGHATASFTLDVYGHVSRKMQMQSAANMERFIKNVS